jgi:hypothetical protein
VEAEFEKLTKSQQDQKGPQEKFIGYSRVLDQWPWNKTDLYWRSFFAAKFGHRSVAYCSNEKEREALFKKSLADYQSFQVTGKNKNTDIHYFTQWQIGLLQHSLGFKWSVAEESFLKAMEYDRKRGEALREIVIYQCLHENWPVAYIYSSYCKTRLLGKIPSNRKWHINVPFYQWKILKYHISILLQLGDIGQSRESAKELFVYYSSNTELSSEERKEINNLQKSWGGLL